MISVWTCFITHSLSNKQYQRKYAN